MQEHIQDVVLSETTRERYLNYALSVITARALPDVRDGLKPVQRRILYAMYQGLRLLPDAKPRKSAAVVGEVMAKYHPHGDQSIYDAMVRMAQEFSLRYPLVDGQGNFGSLDGDPPAAMRYTEARLRHLAVELLSELSKETVDFRPNYDGTLVEPVVLPAQVPNVLINGAAGIAVGMATNIPPHNLGEVVDACIALIDDPDTPLDALVGPIVKGPDFPTGPDLLNTPEELLEIYATGSGSVEMRGQHRMEGRRIVITSLPYGVNKANLVADVAEHIRSERVPQLVDIRDESTDEIRVVLELKRGADEEAALAFLYKRTDLQSRFSVNMTMLAPVDDAEVAQPRRMGLREVLDEFLAFRFRVTRRRLSHDLEQLERRIHLLEAFVRIFDRLDDVIALIRQSDGKADARSSLMAGFSLDWDQAEAILETKLYRLARLEIDALRTELAERQAEAAAIREILASEARTWALIRQELKEIRAAYRDRRRSAVTGPVELAEFSDDAYIVDEDAFVMVTRQGRFKRQKSYTDLSSIRVREGDEVGWVIPASTRESVTFFTDRGKAYTLRVDDVPSTTGYGDPVQTRFDFVDGEHIVGVTVSDARSLPDVPDDVLAELAEDSPRPPYAVAISRGGKAVRFSLEPYTEPSTVAGRLFMRLDSKLGIDGVVAAYVSDGTELVSLATRQGRVLLFAVDEINVLSGPGKGVMAIKLERDDWVLGFELTTERMEGITVETNRGRVEVVRPNKYQITRRGNRGRELIRKGHLIRASSKPLEIGWPEPEPEPDASGEDVDESGAAQVLADEGDPAGPHGEDNGRPGQGNLFGSSDEDP